MATTHTLTGNVYDLTGATLGATGVRVTVVTNLGPKEALIDKTTNSIHLGGKAADLNPSTGEFTVDLIDTSATDLNVVAGTLEYEVRVEYVNAGTRGRANWASGWFPLTADANLADIATDVEPLAVESASGYALEAKGYRDEAATISGLTGEDAAVAFLVGDEGSSTAAALSATIEAGLEAFVPAEVTAQLSTHPEVIDAAAAQALAGAGLVSTANAPAISRNRVPDPQLKTSGGVVNASITTLSRITTGLPSGFSHGIQSVRTGTLSSVISTMYAASISSGGTLPIAVTPGETISVELLAWTDQASARARLDLYFFDASWTLVTNSTGTYSTIAPSTWEARRRAGVTIPANIVWIAPVLAVATTSGNTVTGAVAKSTGAVVVDGNVADPAYADGTTSGWAWEGTPHASASRQVFLPAATNADLATLPSRVAALEGTGSGVVPLTVSKLGNEVTFTSKRGTATVANQGTLNGSANGAYAIGADLYAGASFRPGTDEVTPIRTQMGTVGANHGYTCVRTFANPDGKTTADLGSTWTDGTREYVLLAIGGGLLVVGGSYQTSSGLVTSADVTPTTNLTHVAGATHTGAIVYTTAATTQLYPSIGRTKVTLFADGIEVTADGSYQCKNAEVRETYEVLDYASLYDTAKANVGTSFASLPVDGAVRVSNTFRYRPGGLVEVETSLVELKPTTLGRCGAIQSAPIAAPTRYLPGVGVADGNNWTAGVDMATYSTDSVITESELPSSTSLAPAFSLDVNATGAWAMGYLPYGRKGTEDSTSANRRAQEADADLWDMRGTDKNYPVFIDSRAVGWGRVTANGFRAILTTAEATAVLASKSSAASAWEALDAILALSHG